MLALTSTLLIVPSSADAACGGLDFPNPGLERLVNRHADTIVLARVAGPDHSGPVPVDVPVDVLRIFRGEAERTIVLEQESIHDCLGVAKIGVRIVVAIAESSPEGPFEIVWIENRDGSWRQNFTLYDSLSELLDAFGVLPDTATESAGPDDRTVLTGMGLAAWLVLALAFQLRVRSRRSD